MYDYDLWSDRVRAVARRPIIDTAAQEITEQQPEDDKEEIRARINSVLSANGIRASHISLTKVTGLPEHSINLMVDEDRSAEAKELIKRYN
jgi:acetolactate synthase regulatory subunit